MTKAQPVAFTYIRVHFQINY